MKRKPIKPKIGGCGNCGNNYEVLPLDYDFYGGININTLRIDDKCIEIDDMTLKEVFDKYKREFCLAECVEISIMTPLHDETYELSKIYNKFLLVEQGIGYA